MDQSEWGRLAREGDIEGAIVSYVEENDWVTFPELCRQLEQFLETRGTHAVAMREPTLILWLGMSERLADAFDTVLRAGRVYPHSASLLTYLVDGGILHLPLAKRIPRNGYKTEHWLPVCLRTVPIEL